MPEYKYKRICELSRCGKPFQTNRKDQRFHEDSCRIEWHQTQKSEISDILRRLDALEEEIKKIKNLFTNPDLTQDLKIHLPDLETMSPHYSKKPGRGGGNKTDKENESSSK